LIVSNFHLPTQNKKQGCNFLRMTALGNVFELEKMLQERPHLVTFRDYDFRTALHLAASEGHVDICRFLVEKGAKVSPSDRWGGSPLDDAHRHRHADVVEYLRDQGATFGTKTQLPRFIQAASDGDVNEVTALLEYGNVDLDTGDYDGRTALHLAAGEGRLDVVKLLCEEGADVNVVDRWQNRPLDDASKAKKNSTAIMNILTQYGAKSTQNPSLGSQVMATDTDTAKEVPALVKRTKKKGIDGPSGTIAYNPPEMLVEGATPTPASDMWAAGCIMYVVLTGT
jgi:ankyrin repeat protein